jgi:hypothetical protein
MAPETIFVILFVLVQFCCCCYCCCCGGTWTLESEEEEEEEGASSLHIVGGGRRLLVGSDDGEGRGDLFVELNVLAKETGKEILLEILAVRKAGEGITEEETAGDGELNQRIMRFRFTEEENSAAPAACYPPPSPVPFASFCCRSDYFSFFFYFRLGPRLF